jgi:hypothetical protein
MTKDEFLLGTDAILAALWRRSYEELIGSIDDLEERAARSLNAHQVKVSCADLRLDAALESNQPLVEQRSRFDQLRSLGITPHLELQKSVVLANATGADRDVIESYVRPALERARKIPSFPSELILIAERLVGG